MPVRTVPTDKDAYVDAGSPDTPFGDALSLFVRWQSSILGGNHRETLVGFDLAPVLDDADVLDVLAATLKIPPVTADDGESLDAYEVAPADWTEAGVTWNTKPADGDLQDTASSTDDPHAWDVFAAVDAAFADATQDRVGFLVRMQEGLAGEENSAEYDSREAVGTDPVLDLETREQRRADLDAIVTVSSSGTADLDSFVEVKFFHDRWLGGRQDSLVDAGGNAYTLADLAWDPTLGKVWTTEPDAGAIVRRHHRDGAHEATFEIHEDGAQLAQDVFSVAVSDDGTVFVGLDPGDVNADGDVVECTVDETNQILSVDQRNTAHDVSPDWLAFDGTRVWILDFFAGAVEERHPTNWALNRSGSVGSGDAYRGIARASDHDHLVLFKDTTGELERQDPDDLGTVQAAIDRADVVTTAQGLAFRERAWQGSLFVGEGGDTGSDVWTFAPREIDSRLLIPTPGQAGIDSQLQPSTIPGHADLASQVATGAEADLPTTLTPRVDGHADLDSQVQPASLTGWAELDAIVEVQAVPIEDDHRARAEGRVAPTVVVDEDDMADVSGEVGSPVTVDPHGDARDLRRVVQLLDGPERYPRARAEPASSLARGDAILYAQVGDEIAVGETVTWQGREWRVVGLLGWEMVGDSQLYQEVALRRLAVVHEGRAIGTVT